MPTLNLRLSQPQPPGGLQALAEALTAITAQTLGKQAGLTALLISTLPKGHWFIGGRIAAAPAAELEIAITAGTNSAEQKAAFIAASFAELQRQLARPGQPLTSTSYVIVRELPAGDWGYGGLTQQSRRASALGS